MPLLKILLCWSKNLLVLLFVFLIGATENYLSEKSIKFTLKFFLKKGQNIIKIKRFQALRTVRGLLKNIEFS